MLWAGIALVVSYILNILLGFLPNADAAVLSNISSSTTGFRATMASANWWFPVDTAFLLVASILTIEGSILVWKIARWIVAQVSMHWVT